MKLSLSPKSMLRRAAVPVAALTLGGAAVAVVPSSVAPTVAYSVAPGELDRIANVAESVLPSVVNISSTRANPMAGRGPFDDPFFRRFFGPGGAPQPFSQASGSGVIVNDGVILTNNHVVADAEQLKVSLSDGRDFEAEVVGSDPRSDLAVLRLKDAPRKLPALQLGDSDSLRLGEVVLAVGNPFGLSGSVTMGIVSAKGRADVGIVDYEDFIQTDAAINPGNSGGALVDLEGRLVGINTAILSRSGGYQGIGFAIPSNMVRPIMDSLLETGRVERAWLGIYIQDLDEDLARGLGLTQGTQGVLVSDLPDDSPAARAGIKAGDVVVEFDGVPVDSAAQLRNRVAVQPAGRQVDVEVLRDGKRKTLRVKLGELPGDEAPRAEVAPGTLDGLRLEPLDQQARLQWGVPEGVGGVVVTDVDFRSSAYRAGLRPGDVIVEVNRRAVRDLRELDEAAKADANGTLLRVWSKGSVRFLMLD